MNSHTTLDILKSAAVLDIAGSEDDERLLMLLESVSRQVDFYCNRHFFAQRATMVFDGDGSTALRVPDLVSVDPDGLAADEDGDRIFESVWDESDYLLNPANADPVGGHDLSSPYIGIVVDTEAGSKTAFPVGMRRVRIAGEWGYWRRMRCASEIVSHALDTDTNEIEVSGGEDIGAGHTLLVGTEQIYVLSRTGDRLGVLRGVNGTEAAAHGTAAEVGVFRYPGPVSEAAIIQASRLWKRKDSAFADTSGFTVGLDRDAMELLAPYRKIVAL
ncbi:MAG: hypothetical protein OXC95_13465 [Dehalococcoidia bacterium]|nr:hypothetical protein [Dehalococcoidia bacterium]